MYARAFPTSVTRTSSTGGSSARPLRKGLVTTLVFGISSVILSSGLATCSAAPVVTNQKVFYVPFTVPKGPPEAKPKLVELFVSGDRGETWDAYQQRAPQEGRFSFHAGGDGAYYFATRTVNQNGQAQPAQIETTELIVVVDRTQPTLQLESKVESDGKISVTWNVADDHLAPDLFTLKYRDAADGEASWQLADVRSHSRLLPGGQLQGQISIWPPAGSKLIQLTTEARDLAGNVTVVDRELSTSATAPNLTQQAPALPLLAHGSPPLPAIGPVPPVRQPTNSRSIDHSDEAWNSEPALHAPAPHRDLANGWAHTSGSGGNSRDDGVAMQPSPPVANAYPSRANSRRQTDHANSKLGPTSDYRVSNSHRFELDYDVESGADIDVFRVEVWFTDDGGRSWKHLGDDDDRASPYLVSIPTDGMYGFRLIVQSREGLAARPPQVGDPADAWVQVDATPPSTRLTSAQFGRGKALGTLQITWDVRDNDLRDQPIALFYSGDSNGPWRRIASELANTGRYDWRVDDRTASRIYLRLEAEDRAGNVGVDSLRDPIKSEDLAPRGVIRGVRPVSHAGSTTESH